jgi:hypothetical protein
MPGRTLVGFCVANWVSDRPRRVWMAAIQKVGVKPVRVHPALQGRGLRRAKLDLFVSARRDAAIEQ